MADDKQPGDRLKAVIEALGVTYDEFGELVAREEQPPRKRPYARNNVGEWTSGRSSPKPKTWDAIEVVTGRPMRWYLRGGRPPAAITPQTKLPITVPVPPVPEVEAAARKTRKRPA